MRICLSGPRIRWRVTLFLAILPFASTFANAGEVPKFNQFPVAIYTGSLGKLDLSSADAYSYRTRLREASRQPVNFGGHYQVATWGCGTNCSTGALIDAVTGRVTFLPSVSTTDGMESVIDKSFRAIEFRANSRLMVLSGQINEVGIKGWHFYTFDGGTLRHIYTTAYVAPEAAQTNDSRETPPIDTETKKMSEPLAPKQAATEKAAQGMPRDWNGKDCWVISGNDAYQSPECAEGELRERMSRLPGVWVGWVPGGQLDETMKSLQDIDVAHVPEYTVDKFCSSFKTTTSVNNCLE